MTRQKKTAKTKSKTNRRRSLRRRPKTSRPDLRNADDGVELKLPTLAECEAAIGEKASAWVARCYEISCAIVNAGLVKGVAVYGHWTGPVHPRSHFADKAHLGFISHGWINLGDDQVLDPTRWVFENVEPYLYVGEKPCSWSIIPCATCGLLQDEHRESGPEDRCDNYTQAPWPYDEGGNRLREAMMGARPIPVAEGKMKRTKLSGFAAIWLCTVLKVPSVSKLTSNQLRYVANMSFDVMKGSVGPEGLKAIYTAVIDFSETSIAWIPIDNFERAKRECGLDRTY